jgi:AcrR family transcriptional regulator
MTIESYSSERHKMPRDTFNNLTEKKRNLIEKAAIREFAGHGYEKASISRIVNNCKIAKGSFYQYFDDKKDLFLYLVKRTSEKKLKYMSPVLKNPENYDFFTLIRELFIAGLKFAADNPTIAIMGNWLFKNRTHPIYKEVMGKGLQDTQNIYINLLKHGISKKELRDDIDLDFASYLISSMNVTIVEYYFQNIKSSKKSLNKIGEEIIEIVDMLLDFIKNGIGLEKGGIANGND